MTKSQVPSRLELRGLLPPLRLRRRARRLADQVRVALHYGTTRPSEVRLSDGRTSLHVDPSDDRVYSLLVLRSWRPYYSRLQAFWRAASARYVPTSVVDVGVNAGECLFGTTYPPDACILGFEANPNLARLLQRNLDRHPDRDRITLVSGVASSSDGELATFYVDRVWSGKSSMVPGVATKAGSVEEVTLETTTVDTALSDANGSLDRLLFKIDVEGHERSVFLGMLRSLERSGSAVGFMEFDVAYLRRAGVDPAAFLRELEEHFRVMAFVEGERLVDVEPLGLEGLEPLVADDPCHTDLVLLAGDEAQRFGAWLATWPACLEQS